MAGTASITGPLTRDSADMLALTQRKVKTIHLRFKDTPGEVELRSHLLRDDIVLRDEIPATQPQADIRTHLEQLAQAAGVAFKPEDLEVQRVQHQPVPKPDLSKPTPLEVIADYNRDRRDHPNGADPVYVGEVRAHVKSAPRFLAQIVDAKPETLRYIEIAERDGGEFDWYTIQDDNPNFDIYRFFQRQQAEATQNAIAASQAEQAKARMEAELQKTRDLAEHAADRKAGTIESEPSAVKIDGVKVPRQER